MTPQPSSVKTEMLFLVKLSAILTLDTARTPCDLPLLVSSGSVQFCFSVTVYLPGLPVQLLIVFINIPSIITKNDIGIYAVDKVSTDAS